MAASIKRDAVKQSWEEAEFPLVCETCLGDNPYVRMTRESHGKRCQVCETPFTVFAWQAGTKGRLKRVEICKSCAQAKNVCQVCVYDLQYGLPVRVRDQVLREAGATGGAATAVPQSMANRSWFAAQQQRALDQGQDLVPQNQLAHAQLLEMAQMEPRYERNLPKLCTFYAKGECDRGSNCPFRHELPKHDKNSPMAKQSTKNRFYGDGDPVANKILGRKRRQDELAEVNNDGSDKSRATVYLRLEGEPPYNPPLTEEAIRDVFYACGEIVSVRVQAEKGQAFVEYTQPEGAELALGKNRSQFLGRALWVAWARAPKRGETATTNSGSGRQQNSNKNNNSSNPRRPHGDMATAAAAANATSAAKATAKPVAPPTSSSSNKKYKPLPKGMIAVRPKLNLAPPVAANSGNKHRNNAYPSANPDRLGTKGDGGS